jgi:hypothetical protein
MRTFQVQSDVFYQVRPSEVKKLEALEGGERSSLYSFAQSRRAFPSTTKGDSYVLLGVHTLKITNLQMLTLLKKAIGAVEHTEEYARYMLEKLFTEDTTKGYSIPPGTVRLYSNDLICFYNGKVWRKIKL